MGESASNSDSGESSGATSTPWFVVVLALVVAAAPAAFFANPMQLHMTGEMRAYWGIAVFSSAILAGLAFFRDAEFGYRQTTDYRAEVVAVAWVGTLVAMQAVLSVVFERWSSDMAGMRPVDELMRQLPLWTGCGVIAGLFWQGVFQRNFSDDASPIVRVGLTTLAGVAVWAPFAIHGSAEVASHLLPSLALGYLLAALLHELGTPVWATMLWHGGLFFGLVWFRQALLL